MWAASESTSTASSSSSSTATSVADQSGGGDESGGFIDSPDGGGHEIKCNLWENDCPPSEKCMPWGDDGGSWNATKCTPLARDPNAPGEPCTVVGSRTSGIDDCEAFSMCFFVDIETNTGMCVGFCLGSEANPVCEDPNATCMIGGDGVLMNCIPGCDPLSQDCDAGEACYPVEDHFECAWDGSEDAGGFGDPCEYINVCDPGLFCADTETVPGCEPGFGCCTPFCDLTDPDPLCPPSTTCVAWYEEGQAPPGHEDVGACLEGA